jgi:hypothetical protein
VSVELVESEIRRFLSSDEPEVICITGRWGVGKTYAWKTYVQDAQKSGKIALKSYSYVSLFGIKSLDDLKFAVFENLVKSSDIGIEPSIDTLQSNTAAAARGFVHRLIGKAQNLRWAQQYIGGAPPLLFSFVRKSIVCIDDFERRGNDLAPRDVLGLINNLKEVRKCKVCLILNDEELEHGEEEFRKYLERVVDATLKFVPSPAECTHIALSGHTETDKWLAENCVTLGISNIRVIKKIEHGVNRIKSILSSYDSDVLNKPCIG